MRMARCRVRGRGICVLNVNMRGTISTHLEGDFDFAMVSNARMHGHRRPKVECPKCK
jgi:hypothetical protein